MKRLVRSLVAALVLLAGLVVVASVASPAALAGTTTTTATTASWPALEQTALEATSAYRGDGSLAVVGSPSVVTGSTVATASGVVGVAQQTVVATDGSGTVVLALALLGGRQLVVNEVSPAAGGRGDALVLQPGSSSLVGAYPLRAATSSASTVATRSPRGVDATDAVLHAGRDRARQPTARLVTIGGCYAAPYAPAVIGSTFGPLVEGEGVISCSTSESLSEIVSLYEGSTHVGNTAGGTGGGTWLGIASYDGCTVISGYHSFHTAELWAVNGTLQGGATSSASNLHCQ